MTKILAAAGAIALAAGAAQASVTWSLFNGGDAGFNALTNNGALERAVGEGRIGNNALNGTWERGIWQQGGVGTPQRQGNLAWTSGAFVPWSLTWNGVDTVAFTVAGDTLTWDGVAGGFTDIFVRTRSAADSSIAISDWNLDGVLIGNFFSTGSGDVDYVRIENGGSNFGAFTLRGLVRMDWTGATPTNSALAFQVKLTNVIPTPGALALLGMGGLLVARRRR